MKFYKLNLEHNNVMLMTQYNVSIGGLAFPGSNIEIVGSGYAIRPKLVSNTLVLTWGEWDLETRCLIYIDPHNSKEMIWYYYSINDSNNNITPIAPINNYAKWEKDTKPKTTDCAMLAIVKPGGIVSCNGYEYTWTGSKWYEETEYQKVQRKRLEYLESAKGKWL